MQSSLERGGEVHRRGYPPVEPGERMSDEGRLGRLSGMLKRRRFLLPAFEIHGGAKGLYDFGPVGGRMHSRINQVWRDWLKLGNVVEISCPTVTPYAVLEASGHVGEFSDFMTQCLKCEEASRADTLRSPPPQPRCAWTGGSGGVTVRDTTWLPCMRRTRVEQGHRTKPDVQHDHWRRSIRPTRLPSTRDCSRNVHLIQCPFPSFVNDCRSVLSKLEKATETKSLPGKA